MCIVIIIIAIAWVLYNLDIWKHIFCIFLHWKWLETSQLHAWLLWSRVSPEAKSDTMHFRPLANEAWTEYPWLMLLGKHWNVQIKSALVDTWNANLFHNIDSQWKSLWQQ